MLLRTAPCTSSRSPSFIHNSDSVRETRGASLSQGQPHKAIREKWWNKLESPRRGRCTRTRACRQYMACRTRRIMHSHVRRMSTQWGERGAAGPREGGLVHGKGCYRAVYGGEGPNRQIRQDCCAVKHVSSRTRVSTKAGTSHGAITPWRTWVHESYGFTYTHTTTYVQQ